ncbi:hypothetical protein [Alkalimarinus sediminis]|uniref:DUF1887 family protein n=1 Tax=Alkalimarinus sediminis TaxID=1632866 RepID=A0A9E8HM12_9ALTE|nr:hypothetical protein [Alkalimarinus sediminis]UZW76592.1 hypothetical protein NNL22_08425 [Alkalimarinus sediminis]
MSKHNLPELECCINLMPQYLFLVVSDNTEIQQYTARFSQQIEKYLPDTEIIKIEDPHIRLSGDDMEESYQWIDQQLKPLLERYSDSQKGLNITGGTKVLVMPLVSVTDWDFIDYKAQSTNYIQRHFPLDEKFSKITLPPLNVESAVALYSNYHTVEVRKHLPEQQIETRINTAEKLWHGLQHKEQGLIALFEMLTQLWSINRDQHLVSEVVVPWDEITRKPEVREQLIEWVRRLNALCPEALKAEEHYLTIPGNKIKAANIKNWKNWLCGKWLEELVYAWLLSTDLHEKQISLNIQSGSEKSSASQREADLLILSNGQIYVVEIKADIPPNGKVKSIEEQISSLGDRFGSTKKILLLGPEAVDKLNKQKKMQDFELRCKSNYVSLCTSKQQLLKIVGK